MGWLQTLLRRKPAEQEVKADPEKELADQLEEEIHELKGEYPYLGPPREFKPPGTS